LNQDISLNMEMFSIYRNVFFVLFLEKSLINQCNQSIQQIRIYKLQKLFRHCETFAQHSQSQMIKRISHITKVFGNHYDISS